MGEPSRASGDRRRATTATGRTTRAALRKRVADAAQRCPWSRPHFSAAGQRVFNVSINGTPVLSSFDIVAAAGGPNRAHVRSFSTTANGSGQVIIRFTPGTADQAKVSGLEVQ